MALKEVIACALLCLVAVNAGYLPGQGVLPGGNLRTVDKDGKYNFTLLDVQANEIRGGQAAKGNFSDRDLIHFLTNVECLEGLFDTWGTFGHGFNGDLEKGGPIPIGARAANLSDETRMYLAEVALNEQGHALMTRQAGSDLPCPAIDFDYGWNTWMAAAFGLGNQTIEQVYGRPFDPFLNDQNFVLCVLALEELGATGNKGLIGLFNSPVLANAVAGLATSATAQATIERFVLWNMRNATIEPFNETAQQVFARVSALRDSLDGPSIHDQGLTNTDPRFIAVPYEWVNLIPTDVRGLTFNRSPQQIINILTLGNPDGKGVFFPNGLNGKLNKPTGYADMKSGKENIHGYFKTAGQESRDDVGVIPPPITGPTPATVPGYDALTQGIDGQREDTNYTSRGYSYPESGTPYYNSSVFVEVAYSVPVTGKRRS